jgi:anti-anti-sigma factor
MENRREGLRFECREGTDSDGARRLTLLGEVDIAVAEELAGRLAQLEQTRTPGRLDLSELRFIDLCGLDAILAALRRGRRSGWRLEVDRRVSRSVERIISFAGVEAIVWPPGGGGQAPAKFQPFMSRWSMSSVRSDP